MKGKSLLGKGNSKIKNPKSSMSVVFIEKNSLVWLLYDSKARVITA